MEQNANKAGETIAAADATSAPAWKKPGWLGHFAHDLRGPLSPIQTGISLLRSGRLDTSQQGDLLDMMQRQLDTLTQLIEDSADLLAARSGSTSSTEIASLFDMVSVRLARRLAEIGVSFETHLPEKPITLVGDAKALVRLIAHLAWRSGEIAGSGQRVSAQADAQAGGVCVRFVGGAGDEARQQFAALIERLSNAAPSHVADAMLHDILVRHAATLTPLPGEPGMALHFAAK